MSNLSDFFGGNKVGSIVYADSINELPGGVERWLPLDGSRYSSSAYPRDFVKQPYLFKVDANVMSLDNSLTGSLIWFKAYRIDGRRLVFIPNTTSVAYLIAVDIATGENRKVSLPSVGSWHTFGGWCESGAYVSGPSGVYLINSAYVLEKLSSSSLLSTAVIFEIESSYLLANNTVISSLTAIHVEIIDKKTKATKQFDILRCALKRIFILNLTVFVVWTEANFYFYDLDGSLLKTLSSRDSSMHKLADGALLMTNYPDAKNYSILYGCDEIESIISPVSMSLGFSNQSVSFFGCGDTVIVDGVNATYLSGHQIVARYADKERIAWVGIKNKLSFFVITVDGMLKVISVKNGFTFAYDLLSIGALIFGCVELDNRYVVATSNNAGQKTYVLIDLESLSFFNVPVSFNLYARIE